MKRPSHSLRLMAVLMLAGVLFSACATNPVTKQSQFVLMSEDQELKLGQEAAAQVAKQLPLMPADDPLVQYVDKVGQRVAAVADRPDLIYRFHVIDEPTINAFALPGGYIYIYRGLLVNLNSEAELAAVLGHEIGHVTARHAVQQYTQAQSYRLGMAVASIFVPIPQAGGQLSNLLVTAIIRGYSRQDELQADELSIKYIAKAGYDVHATTDLLKTLKRLEDLKAKEEKDTTGKPPETYHGAFATHPRTEKRIKQAVAEAAGKQSELAEDGHNAMLAALDGYPYGDSPDQGAVVGHRFLHPKLGIQIKFPKGWVIENSPRALNAQIRQKKVFFQMQLKELQKHRTAAEMIRKFFPDRHIGPITQSQRDGFKVGQAVVTMSAPHISQARILATVFLEHDKAFVTMGWCDRHTFDAHQSQFESIADSFRHYDAKRDGGIPRVHLIVWKQGDSWQLLARHSHNILGRFTANKIAVMNGMGLNETPKAGTVIKTVR